MNVLRNHKTIVLGVAVLSAVVFGGLGSSFDIGWHTVDGGGAASTGSSYELTGLIGQPDAGVMYNSRYQLVGGFWATEAFNCPWDLDNDGSVGSLDLAMLLGQWGSCGLSCIRGKPFGPCTADFDLDCDVDAFNLAQLQGNWGACP